LLGDFAWELLAFKTQLNAFSESAIADFAELVFPCYAADGAVWAGAFLHFWAFFAGDSANTDSHVKSL
jgi:hypothetical protein